MKRLALATAFVLALTCITLPLAAGTLCPCGSGHGCCCFDITGVVQELAPGEYALLVTAIGDTDGLANHFEVGELMRIGNPEGEAAKLVGQTITVEGHRSVTLHWAGAKVVPVKN